MLNKLFNELSGLNKKFSLGEEKIMSFVKEQDEANKTNEITESIKAKSPTKILVKAASGEKNTDYYNILLKEEKVSITKGIEVLKSLGSVEIKVLVNDLTEALISDIKGIDGSLKLKNKELTNTSEVKAKAFGSDEVLVLELNEVIRLGEEALDLPRTIILSVFGDAIEGNKVVKVSEGTTVSELFSLLNGNEEKLGSIVVGGILTGQGIYNLNRQLLVTDNSIVFKGKITSAKETTCIRCAKCLRQCPKGLSPIKLVEEWKKKNTEEFLKLGGDTCIDCGLCSYVCPCNIELAHTIKTAKEFINKK